MKGQALNILLVVIVVAIVAGAAWFKSHRAAQPVAAGPAATQPAAAPAAATAQPPASVRAGKSPTAPLAQRQPSEAKPEPKPAASPEEHTAAADTAAPKKLPRLIDLGADKCIPCKKMAPILEELRKEYAGRLEVKFIDVWKNPSAKAPYKIRVIPTQVLFDADGKEVWRHEGYISKEDLKKLFAQKVGVK